MSDAQTTTLIKNTVKKLSSQKDMVEIWETEFAETTSELKVLLTAQTSLKEGIDLLKGAEMVTEGGLKGGIYQDLASLEQDVTANVADVAKLEGQSEGRLQEVTKLHADIKKWEAAVKKEPLVLEGDPNAALLELAKLPTLMKTLNEWNGEVGRIRKIARDAQASLVAALDSKCREAAARLKTEKNSAWVYKWIQTGVSVVASVVAMCEPTLVGPGMTAVKVSVTLLTDAAQEAEVRIRQAGLSIDDAIKYLSPFGTYRSNLIRLNAAFRAGFHTANFAGCAPVAGAYISAGIEILSEGVKGVIDGRIEEVEEKEEELNKKLQALKDSGKEVTKEELDDLRKEADQHIATDYKEALKKGLENLKPAKDKAGFAQDVLKAGGEAAEKALDATGEVLKKAQELGISADPGEMAGKALTAITEALIGPVVAKLAEAFLSALNLMPGEPPRAIFNFEIAAVLTGDVEQLLSDFTVAEKNSLLDIWEIEEEAPPTFSDLKFKLVSAGSHDHSLIPGHTKEVKVAIGSVLPDTTISGIDVAKDGPGLIDGKSGAWHHFHKNKFLPDDKLHIWPTFFVKPVTFLHRDNKTKDELGRVVKDVTIHVWAESLSGPTRFKVKVKGVGMDSETADVSVVLTMERDFARVMQKESEITITCKGDGTWTKE